MGTSEGVIVAAGGILCRSDPDGERITVVERARYAGEIALPKGKIREHETVLEAAKREVLEETGLEVKNPTFAGTICYFLGSTPKIVFFYKMELAVESSAEPRDPEEIAHVKWLRPSEAVQKLTHEEARKLITEVFRLPPIHVHTK